MEEQQKLNSFSVVIPTCNRRNLMQYAIRSVQNQMYRGDFEIIVVDDGSEDDTWSVLQKIAEQDPRVKIFKHERRMQRLFARNTGLKNATKDYICHLDSDDEYVRSALDSYNWAINEYPNYQCFHFGAIVCRLNRYEIRPSFDLKEENNFGEAMDRFQSGRIGMGSFFYKRSIHDDIGYFPEVGVPYDFADYAKKEFPEMIEWFGPPDRTKIECKTLGNPVGDDYFLFYKITRKYKSKMVPFLTYVQYVRRSGFLHMDEDLKLR